MSQIPETSTAHGRIYERVRTLVQTPHDLVALYPNSPPIDKNGAFGAGVRIPDPEEGEAYLEIVMEPGRGFQAELGAGGRHRNPGDVVVTVLTPLGRGTKRALDIVESVKGAFRSTQVDDLVYTEASDLPGSRSEDGAWWRTPVSIAFHYDD